MMVWLLLLVGCMMVSFLGVAAWVLMGGPRPPEEEQNGEDLEAAHLMANPIEQPKAAEAPSLEKRRPFVP